MRVASDFVYFNHGDCTKLYMRKVDAVCDDKTDIERYGY